VSSVTSILLSFGSGECITPQPIPLDNNLPTINAWLVANGHGTLNDISGTFGGEKHHEGELFAGAFNCLDVRAFVWRVRTLHWRAPDRVQILVKQPDEDTFTTYTAERIQRRAQAMAEKNLNSMLTPNDHVVTLIQEATDRKTASTLHLPPSIQPPRPPALIIYAAHGYNVTLLKEVLASTVLMEKGMVAAKRYPGNAPMHQKIYELLVIADNLNRVVMFEYEPWPIQERPVSMVVVGTGQRIVDMLEEYALPVLKQEDEAMTRDRLITGTPDDIDIDKLTKGTDH
jgi:hypothetical protein